jgi:hypothetical protein
MAATCSQQKLLSPCLQRLEAKQHSLPLYLQRKETTPLAAPRSQQRHVRTQPQRVSAVQLTGAWLLSPPVRDACAVAFAAIGSLVWVKPFDVLTDRCVLDQVRLTRVCTRMQLSKAAQATCSAMRMPLGCVLCTLCCHAA